jgi:predicted component of type VI protein secretion system
MQVVLVMFRSDGEKRSFSVVRDITVLGRREDCDLRIPLSDISRKHCRIIRSSDSVRIEDLGSSNGTLCNGERVTSVALRPGDTLTVGPVTFVVQIDGMPADDHLSPYASQEPTTPQDTAAAAAAVGVGMVQEVGPRVEDELEELDELDLGAAPLIASADDDDEILEELEPLPELETAEAGDPEALEELETVEDESAEPMEDLAHLDEVAEPAPAPPPARATAPVAKPAPMGKPPRVSAPVPPPVAAPVPAAPHEPLEGELQASDQFEVISEQSAFDIVMDDASHSSATGEIEIDWSTESKP